MPPFNFICSKCSVTSFPDIIQLPVRITGICNILLGGGFDVLPCTSSASACLMVLYMCSLPNFARNPSVMKILFVGDVKEKDESTMKYLDILSTVLLRIDDREHPTIFSFRKGLKNAIGIGTGLETMNVDEFEEMKCTVDIDFCMDLLNFSYKLQAYKKKLFQK